MRYLTLLLAVFLVGCGSDSSTAPAPPADAFWSQPGPAVRVTVLAGTKEAPAKVGRIRVEAIWDTTDGDTLKVLYKDSVSRATGSEIQFCDSAFAGYKMTGWVTKRRKEISAEFNVYGNDSAAIGIMGRYTSCTQNGISRNNCSGIILQTIYFKDCAVKN